MGGVGDSVVVDFRPGLFCACGECDDPAINMTRLNGRALLVPAPGTHVLLCEYDECKIPTYVVRTELVVDQRQIGPL